MARQLGLYTDNFYHIFNRGALKREIFLDDGDYFRWVKLMYWCLRYNYSLSKFLSRVDFMRRTGEDSGQVEKEIAKFYSLPQRPVEMIAWVLMPNHFHLVLKQLVEAGISSFMHRLTSSYSHYFNRKYEGTGTLFQGRFRAVLVDTEEQFLHLCRYVHINPLSAGLASRQTLPDYSWSSFRYYMMGKDDLVTTREYLESYFPSIRLLGEFTLAGSVNQEAYLIEGLTIDDDFGWYEEKRACEKIRRDNLIEEVFKA
ncbi:hypothetical protein B5M47_00930 [candidate division CPR3 bacterium 4484_211]|uniref:Transposase IS200-like domain-containing protein n=1 Tax=candidate division CPR3 bacterium 4484_211 TaxID=1968527 RepID=A0A1W9NZ35_UNCC3|nr:MAG: hypothetical protein B5M47_00930 [candidate division CPR3 bacterium 4484_211]